MNVPLAIPTLWRQPVDRARPAATETPLEFGNFRVLPRQRRLLANGTPVELGTRAFDILMVLIEADGALVTGDELLTRVWPGIVVAPDNVKVQIAALRKALGEERGLILTDHGRGYRFTAAVRSTVDGWGLFSPPGLASNRLQRRRYRAAYPSRGPRRRRRTGSALPGRRSFDRHG
jgi:DNA-binding winged helix-turn-helix (wHTH) protein